MARITIKDIARLLEISPSTVSRALKDHPDISIGTRDAVKKVASELGYSPNIQAINFRKRESKLIGLILPDMNMFFFPSVIQAIELEVRERGYHLIVLHSNDKLEREIENVDICQNFGVDGLLVSVSKETNNIDHFAEIREQHVPVVFFDKVIENKESSMVIIMDEEVAEKAVGHLIDRGRRRICGLFGNPNLTISKHRYIGFKRALESNGLQLPAEYGIFANDLRRAKAAIYDLLQSNSPPDAIFAMSDELLVGTMEAVNECKFVVPEDISVISISDGHAPYFFHPPVTYVEHSGARVGRAAVDLLFNQIEQKQQLSPKRVVLPTHLVVQGST